MKKLIKLLPVFILLFCCKEIDKEEKQQLDTETKVINYSELNLDSVYKIKIYNQIENWMNYIELSEFIEQLNLNDFSSVIDNKKYLIRFFNVIKNTIPNEINKPEIKSRLTVIETDFLRFEALISNYEINDKMKRKMVKKINNSFSNLNYQIDKLTEKREIIPE